MLETVAALRKINLKHKHWSFVASTFHSASPPGREVPPYKSEGGARRKISRTTLKGIRVLFYGRVQNSFPPLRRTNSTTTIYVTGSVNFNSNEDNFGKLSSQGLFENIVINLYPNKPYHFLAAVILGFSPLGGTNPQIYTPKRYDEHPPVTLIGEYSRLLPRAPLSNALLFFSFFSDRILSRSGHFDRVLSLEGNVLHKFQV